MKTHTLLFLYLIVLSSSILVANASIANDNSALSKASIAACNNIKMCIKKQTSEELDLSPAMIKMIEQMAEDSCKSLYEINDLTSFDDLKEPITKCYEAMAKASCDQLEEGTQPKACVELEKAVENLE